MAETLDAIAPLERMTRKRLVGAFAALLLLSGGGIQPSYELHEIRRYGTLDVETDAPARWVASGGGVLSAIAGVAQLSDSTVYVLDQQWAKIVEFRLDGSVRSILGAGRGQGPGEFETAVHLAVADDGLLSVLDGSQPRVTFFRPSGEIERTIPVRLSAPLRHFPRRDTIWITRAYRADPSQPIVHALSGGELTPLPGSPPDPRDAAFGPGVGISGRGDRLVVSSAQPGIWYELRGGTWTRRGEPLYPDLKPPREEWVSPRHIGVIPAQANVAGIAVLGDTLVLQRYSRFPRPFDYDDPPAADEVEHWLLVSRADGMWLDNVRLSLPGIDTKYLYVSPLTGHIFIGHYEPFPQVVEFELRRVR